MTGRHQTLSKGQKKEVVQLFRKKILTWVLLVLALITGVTGYSLLKIKESIQKKAETLVAKQFEEPKIQKIVENVAAEQAAFLTSARIEPQVTEFEVEVTEKLRELSLLVVDIKDLKVNSQKHEHIIKSILIPLQHSFEESQYARNHYSTIKSDNVEMMSGEMVLKIFTSYGNIQRAFDDIYKTALDEALKGGYIFEINEAPGQFGSDVFMTDISWRSGEVSNQGSSYLLTTEEKIDISSCLKSYFEKEKSGDVFIDMDRQKKIFLFLLQNSNIGSITQSLSCEITYMTSYHESKTELLTPLSKLGAVIGHIGDKIINYE